MDINFVIVLPCILSDARTLARADISSQGELRVYYPALRARDRIRDICVCLMRDIERLQPSLTALWLTHYCNSLGDFDFFRMDTMAAVRYNGGFARFGALEPADYLDAAPDACQPYAAAVMNHMNADHSDATKAMVLHYVGLEVDKAEIVSLDRLGMMVKVESKWGGSKIRLPFTRECTDRKVCKEIIVEMTQASAGASVGAKV